MTTKGHKALLPPLPPKRPADTRYGLHVLDRTLEEIWWGIDCNTMNSPAKSDAVNRTLQIFKQLRITHDPVDGHLVRARRIEEEDEIWDLRGMCEEAQLSEAETDVLVLAGNGLTQRGIGVWLEISQTSVWRHLHSGRAKLNDALPDLVAVRLRRLDILNQEAYTDGGETRPSAVV